MTVKDRIVQMLSQDPENAYSVLEIAEALDGGELEEDVMIARMMSNAERQIPRYEKPLEELLKDGRIGAGFKGTRRFYFAKEEGKKDVRS